MESFFWESSFLDEVEIKELLLRRYHTLAFIQEVDLFEFIDFVNLARKKDKEEKLYIQWCAMLPQFNQYVKFEEFMDMMTGSNIDMRPAEEIIKEIEELHAMKGGENGA